MLKINFPSKFYKNTGAIDGNVTLYVNKEIKISKITLFFKKIQKINIEYNNEAFKNYNIAENRLVIDKSFDIDIYGNKNNTINYQNLRFGKYEFPFSFLLPYESKIHGSDRNANNLNNKIINGGSTKLISYHNDVCVMVENTYQFSAKVFYIENDKNEIFTSEISNLNILQETDPKQKLKVSLKVFNILFYVIKKTLYIKHDKLFYFSGDLVNIEIENIKIKSIIHIEIYENFKFIDGFVRSKKIAEEIVNSCKNKNFINCNIKLPYNCAATCEEETFSVEIVLKIKFRYFKNEVVINKTLNVINPIYGNLNYEEYYPHEVVRFSNLFIEF
ncbi:20S proteasome subunit [Ecytonucleospora hepatopenaei]|uniref:20S proteasome subunit n=1 Tax=Ecytonucleospora hepatopenaei TaxID=646526 RepID=A0A1W0E3E4_9MICR|nr:20S proteasome subunit [Ecytonucleospora hepatopenaei]